MLLYFRFIRFDSLGRRGSVLISTQVSRENESKSVSSPKEQFTTGTRPRKSVRGGYENRGFVPGKRNKKEVLWS